MKRVWKEIKYWCQLFLLPIHWLTCLFPRSKRIWAFGSTFGRRFADNPKYFYLYLLQHKSSEIKVVWISKSRELAEDLRGKGLESFYLYSLKGIWYCLRAGVYLYDNYSKDICYTLSGGAVKINLWHGIPLKKIQKDNLFDYIRNPRTKGEALHSIPRRISDEKPSDYVLATSDYLKPYFASAFQTERVLVSGYPRNDCILQKDFPLISTGQEQRTLEKVRSLNLGRRLVLYMPTFRESESKFFDVMDLKRFEQFLARENILFMVKLHPKSKLYDRFSTMEGENILIIDKAEDPYPLLQYVELLLTDYSSVYFDFLLSTKPILFFPYDFSEYLSESRDLYFDYDDFTPGRKVYNQEELEEALTAKEDPYAGDRQRLQDLVFHPERSQNGSEALYQEICKILRNRGKGKV